MKPYRAVLLAPVRHADDKRGLAGEIRKVREAPTGVAAMCEMLHNTRKIRPSAAAHLLALRRGLDRRPGSQEPTAAGARLDLQTVLERGINLKEPGLRLLAQASFNSMVLYAFVGAALGALVGWAIYRFREGGGLKPAAG